MNITAPIYVTDVCPKTGALMLGGIFKMQDTVGFPIDASHEECKARGHVVDWLEAMADCWLNDCLKFDSFVRQANSITKENLGERFSFLGAAIIKKYPKMLNHPNPVDVACRYILAKKRIRRPII